MRAFENDPRVVLAVSDEGGRNGETLSWLNTFWTHHLLRGQIIFDADGSTSQALLGQPRTGLPFGRGFVVGPDGRVVLPYFGHQPQRVVELLRELAAQVPWTRRATGRLR